MKIEWKFDFQYRGKTENSPDQFFESRLFIPFLVDFETVMRVSQYLVSESHALVHLLRMWQTDCTGTLCLPPAFDRLFWWPLTRSGVPTSATIRFFQLCRWMTFWIISPLVADKIKESFFRYSLDLTSCCKIQSLLTHQIGMCWSSGVDSAYCTCQGPSKTCLRIDNLMMITTWKQLKISNWDVLETHLQTTAFLTREQFRILQLRSIFFSVNLGPPIDKHFWWVLQSPSFHQAKSASSSWTVNSNSCCSCS